MPKRILVLGANGMLGGSIFRYLSSLIVYQVKGTVRLKTASQSLAQQGFDNVISGIDVIALEKLETILLDFRPDFIINCVGVIKQLEASKDPITSINLNSLLPHRLALLSNKYNSRLIHFSTDCVFTGNRGMYTELDLADAQDLYGRSKLLGEVNYLPHLTLRTSIIGHELKGHLSLVDWFLSQDKNIKGYTKAFFSGLPTVYVAEFLNKYVLTSQLSGLYHLGVEPINKHDLLLLIKAVYDIDIEIEKFKGVQIDRSLDYTKLRRITGFEPPSWRDLIERMHNEYQKYF